MKSILNRLFKLSIAILTIFSFQTSLAQPVSQTFDNAGNFTYTIPTGYTATLTVEVWGGGGGGAAGTIARGGGGGAYARSQFTDQSPGSYTVVVGAAGAAGNSSGTPVATAGGQSSFSRTGVIVTVIANGGGAGTTTVGLGGAVGTSGNQANFKGGDGGNIDNGGNSSGGGGGASAANSANGGNGGNGVNNGTGGAGGTVSGTGITFGAGGKGGDRNGNTVLTDAFAGSAPGGGGGGRGADAGTSKPGAVGRVVITVSNVLPITLANFQARSEEGGALITWKVASEINNDKMLLERSKDGQRFQQIGQVKGRGTSTVPFEYQFLDENPGPGSTYYRLKQVDFDGTFEYSKVIVLDTEGFIQLYIYPNPAQERIFVRSSEEVINNGLHLFDALGRKTLLQWNGGSGLYEASLPKGLPSGLYLLSDARGEHQAKVCVQH